MKRLKGRDVLSRVHNRKPKLDAEHRVPTRSGLHSREEISSNLQAVGGVSIEIFLAEYEEPPPAVDVTSVRIRVFSLKSDRVEM